jgi:hypothetical protein
VRSASATGLSLSLLPAQAMAASGEDPSELEPLRKLVSQLASKAHRQRLATL